MKSLIYRRLPAGQPGTKRMMEIYGDKLVCVRYRYDGEKKVKYKTVELVVDSGYWESKVKLENEGRRIELKIDYNEIELRAQVKEAGGIWKNEKKVWEIGYKSKGCCAEAKKLGLEERIVSK